MASHNRIIIVGHTQSDPDSRVTNSGDSFARFQLAVDRPSRDGMGGLKDYIQVVAWRQLAQDLSFKAGDLVLVEGRIQTRSYEDQEGKRKYVTEVEARDVKTFDSYNSPISVSQESSFNSPIESNPETFVSNDAFDFSDSQGNMPKNEQEVELQEEDIPF